MAKPVSFTEATYIALHAMAYLALEEETPVSIKKIASELGVSEAHLAKVVQRLSKSALLKTVRGPGGGVALARRPEDITYLEIFEAIEGPFEPAGCVFGYKSCIYGKCIFGDYLAKVSGDIFEWLKSVTLDDFQRRTEPIFPKGVKSIKSEAKRDAEGPEKNNQDK
jgi:Rrf2 family nitric oxide-sensitive transcriptional repressor